MNSSRIKDTFKSNKRRFPFMQYFTDTDMGLDIGLVNLAVESAFADHGRGLVQMPPKLYITLPPVIFVPCRHTCLRSGSPG